MGRRNGPDVNPKAPHPPRPALHRNWPTFAVRRGCERLVVAGSSRRQAWVGRHEPVLRRGHARQNKAATCRAARGRLGPTSCPDSSPQSCPFTASWWAKFRAHGDRPPMAERHDSQWGALQRRRLLEMAGSLRAARASCGWPKKSIVSDGRRSHSLPLRCRRPQPTGRLPTFSA